MGYGMARYSKALVWVSNCTFTQVEPPGQAGRRCPSNKTTPYFSALPFNHSASPRIKSDHCLPNKAPKAPHIQQSDSITVQRPSVVPNQIHLIAHPTDNLHPIKPKALKQLPHALLQFLETI